MKFNAGIFCWLIILILFNSCSEENNLKKVIVGEEFYIPLGESVSLVDTEKYLADLQLMDVQDSRCPADAQCIRAGDATITISLKKSPGQLLTGELCIGECLQYGNQVILKDTATFSIENTHITLILVGVDPYPVLDDPVSEKTAHIIFESYTVF